MNTSVACRPRYRSFTRWIPVTDDVRDILLGLIAAGISVLGDAGIGSGRSSVKLTVG